MYMLRIHDLQTAIITRIACDIVRLLLLYSYTQINAILQLVDRYD